MKKSTLKKSDLQGNRESSFVQKTVVATTALRNLVEANNG